jgi:Chaperone of endosialidase
MCNWGKKYRVNKPINISIEIMKKTILLLVLLFHIKGNVSAQIFATKSANGSITLMPVGITDRQSLLSSTNTALGESTMPNASTVTNNTAIGSQALQNLGINFPNAYNGNNNTAVGYQTLLQNVQGYDNAALGFSTMYGTNISNNSNTVFGRNIMYAITSGSNNAAFGDASLLNNTTGNNNSAFGQLAMTANVSSNFHLAFGLNALQNHITNDNSTAVGRSALAADQSGTNNVALGNATMNSNTSGNSNTGLGNFALGSNKTGTGNVAFGHIALFTNDGQNNTVAGYVALDLNTTGSNNVVIGLNALHTNITGSGNVAIGSLAGYGETGSNKLYIDNAITPFTALTPAIGGDFTANKVCIACNMANTGVNDFITRSEAFQVTGNAFKTLGSGLWIFPSDRRLKTKIVSLNREEILSKILQLQGVNYNLITFPEQGMQYGFIAQDLRKIFPAKVYENKDGYLSSSYGDYVPMFVEALKALNERVEKLEEKKIDMKALSAQVEKMEKVFNEK